MEKIKIEDAIGNIILHDMTRIVKGEIKDAVFRKGHVVTEEDIPILLSMGKDHIYACEVDESMVHEDDAAFILSNLCINDNMIVTEVKEGKMELIATCNGLFQVDVERLNSINNLDDIMIATRMGNIPVKAGDKLAGMRVIPLVIEEDKLNRAKEVAGDMPILKLTPFKSLKAGIITTGNEVYYGRIKDTFTPVIETKLKDIGIEVVKHLTSKDDIEEIKSNILEMKKENIDLIICTGGMSVDPDDLTPAAIKSSGSNIVTYGAPVLPGAMFLLAYFDDGSTIMGLPGCAMYEKNTIFDIILPYVSAGIQVNKSHIKKLGYGGLCLDCHECNYPNCQFGKGV